MDWQESLEIVVSRTHHARYRVLCDEGNPDLAQRDGYRALMVSLATGEPIRPAPAVPSYPPLATQAANLAGSLKRWWKSGLAVSTAAEARRRRAICKTCPIYDPAQMRCRRCGCSTLVKPWLKSERCPDNPPRW